ncbi:hypothetical protein B0T19DRAFT_481224 [Cercophora scortea]|uniref:Uncharacterized protein n=1 Tax=Cercophora scortea TaxID=314031 RepID=A0AAE0MM62_9PEZI|nr:hypothetical protein B0T19DRAFT_481224 [Cercophora scortea]
MAGSTTGGFQDPVAQNVWSPSCLSGSSKIPRRYFQIPKNQQVLLNRGDAWSSHGFPNIPTELLEGLKAFHARNLGSPSQGKSSTTRSGPQRRSEQNSSREHQENDESDPGTPIPWSPSPERETRVVAAESDEESDTVAARAPAKRVSPVQQPRRPPVSRALYSAALPDLGFPSSSLASEAGLEFAVPGAVTDVPEPAQLESVAIPPEPTPPSAQIIPSTYAERSSPPRLPEAKRRRLMKPVTIGLDSPGLSTGQQSRSSLAVPIPDAPSVAQESFATSNKPSSSALGATSHSLEQTSTGTSSTNGPNIPAANVSAALTTAVAISTGHRQSSSAEKLPPNGPASQVPHTAFTLAYPDYRGSLGDFVRAVMCIQDLRRKKALPPFLYDDFVRVFCGSYIDYIRELDDQAPALTAIQWYCDGNVTAPVYSKNVLNASNINDVLDKYPDDVRSIRRSLGSPEVVTKDKSSQNTPEVMSPSVEAPALLNGPSTSAARSTPMVPFTAVQAPVIHPGELASDPIDLSGQPQPQPPREPRRAISRTLSNPAVSKFVAPHRVSPLVVSKPASGAEAIPSASKPLQREKQPPSSERLAAPPKPTANATPMLDKRDATLREFPPRINYEGAPEINCRLVILGATRNLAARPTAHPS